MPTYQDRFNAVVTFGKTLKAFVKAKEEKIHNIPYFDQWEKLIALAGHKNGWFTEENIWFATAQWANELSAENLQNWVASYPSPTKKPIVLLIMAGNIPLVGFHDFLTAYLADAKILIKLASNDQVLLPWILNFLQEQTQEDPDHVKVLEKINAPYDALIATGSDNTARYFEHYFGHKPHIIRKNRNSVAVITGKESPEVLQKLGEDVFRYFGLGCRSVSKIYVPEGYDFDLLFKALYGYKDLIEYEKYSNNYDYNKAVYLMSMFKILDNGFLIIKEDSGLTSPIGSLHFEYYTSLKSLEKELTAKSDLLQCIVGPSGFLNGIAFGTTQKPSLTDYADGVDTMNFILSL